MRTWLEIDLKNYRENIRYIRSLTLPEEEIMLVVKANCYGIGNRELVEIAFSEGINNFAVATVEEGVDIRKHGFMGCNIFVLGHTSLEELEEVEKNDLIIAVTGKEHAQTLLDSTSKKLKIAIAVDTGMSRIGFPYREVEEDGEIFTKLSQKFEIKSVFTHLSQADSISAETIEFTNLQISKFFLLKDKINIGEKWHYKNSAGLLKRLTPKSDYVRVGIIQYGIMPSQELSDKNLKQIFTWKAKIGCVKEVEAGAFVGYGRNFLAKEKIKVATIDVGYGDGYNRLLSNKGRVIVNDKYCNIIGNVCMDQFMIDVSSVGKVQVGDSVVLIGQTENCKITLEELAEKCMTISYEIICNINPTRVKRIYKNK